MLSEYHKAAKEREILGIPALPLNAEQTQELTVLLEHPPTNKSSELLYLLRERVPRSDDTPYRSLFRFLVHRPTAHATPRSLERVVDKLLTRVYRSLPAEYRLRPTTLLDRIDFSRPTELASRAVRVHRQSKDLPHHHR